MRAPDRIAPALAAIALAVLSLALRLPRGDLAEWKGDEAVELAKARAIALELRAGEIGAVLRARGIPTTEGPRCQVHAFYVMALPLLVSESPESERVFFALLSTGAVVALFLLGRRELGARATLAAALVLAVHPLVVREGRWAWLPNLTPPAATLVLLALARTLKNPRGRGAGALLLLATVLALLHYSTIGIAGLGVVASVHAVTRGANRRAFALGAALSIALVVPFLASELGSGFQETRAALAVASHGGRVSHDLAAPERERLAFAREALAALDLERLARTIGHSGEARVRQLGPNAGLLRALTLLLGALVLGGVVLGGRELLRAFDSGERISAAGLALATFLAAWAPFFVLKLPARSHYVACVVPALAVLAGAALVSLVDLVGRFLVGRVSRRESAARALAAALLFLFASVSVLEARAFLAAIDQGASEPGSDYDLPLRDKEGACEIVLRDELELARWRRFEDVLLLEQAFRDLARREPERARRFSVTPLHENYWELDVSVPRPLAPRGRVAFETAGVAPVASEVEIGRSGAIVVRRLP